MLLVAVQKVNLYSCYHFITCLLRQILITSRLQIAQNWIFVASSSINSDICKDLVWRRKTATGQMTRKCDISTSLQSFHQWIWVTFGVCLVNSLPTYDELNHFTLANARRLYLSRGELQWWKGWSKNYALVLTSSFSTAVTRIWKSWICET